MKLLVRATNWVGDVAMSLPALKALRASFPDDHIGVLARPWVADLYRVRPEVDELLVEDSKGSHAGAAGRSRLAAEIRSKAFDRAILFPTSFGTAWTLFRAGIPERIGYRGDLRTLLLTRPLAPRPADEHQVFKYIGLVGAAGGAVPARPDTSWNLTDEIWKKGRACLESAGWKGTPFLAAHVASFAHAAKRWDLARYAATFDRLAKERDLRVILLGSSGERSVNEELAGLLKTAPSLDLSGKSSLVEVLGILGLSSLFVGNDSGLAHLAGAVGAPTVIVFGPTDPSATRPWDGPRGDGKPVRIQVVRRPPPCAPCRYDVCPIEHQCMAAVSVENVCSAVDRVLA